MSMEEFRHWCAYFSIKTEKAENTKRSGASVKRAKGARKPKLHYGKS